MTIRKIYVADDGEEFENKRECEEYERKFKAVDSVVFFDENCEKLMGKDPGDLMNNGMFLFIKNAEKAEQFFEWEHEYYGYNYPQDPKTGGLYYYDEHDDEYYDLIEEISKLTDQRDKILTQL